MEQVPLFLPTLAILAVVWLEWRQTRPVAIVAAAAAFVLLVAVLRYPGFSAQEIVEFASAHLAVPLAVARTVGAACFLYSVVRLIRASPIPW